MGPWFVQDTTEPRLEIWKTGAVDPRSGGAGLRHKEIPGLAAEVHATGSSVTICSVGSKLVDSWF